jgi:nucleotide-binding universal stress UspA family protein
VDARECVIVCGVDGSEAGQRALDWAVDEAERRGCRLRAVTVWSWDAGTATISPAEARSRAVELQNRALATVVSRGLELAVERRIAEGRPSEQVCAAAEDADLIVLGSHGRGAVHGALVGSTSQHVIRHAPCPVVVLPDPRAAEREHRRAHAHHRLAQQQGTGPMF